MEKKLYRNDILQKLRKEQGLSLRKAESLTGVCKTSIMYAESGKPSITVETLAKLTDGYRIPINFLFDFKLDVKRALLHSAKAASA